VAGRLPAEVARRGRARAAAGDDLHPGRDHRAVVGQRTVRDHDHLDIDGRRLDLGAQRVEERAEAGPPDGGHDDADHRFTAAR
jgi:hypothetical protein